MYITFKALSPIHIHNGKELDPFDYILGSDRVLIINHQACLDTLYSENPDYLIQYTGWIDDLSRKISTAEEEAKRARRDRDKKIAQDKNLIIQGLRQNFNIIYFAEKVINRPDLAEDFRRESQYHKYSAYCPSRPKNLTKLKEVIKKNGQLYVPGSSIKGALRTALAYRVISELTDNEVVSFLDRQDQKSQGILAEIQQLKSMIANVVSARKRGDDGSAQQLQSELRVKRNRLEKRIGAEVEKFIFGCDDGKGKLDDPKFDIMRLVRVSDTMKSQAEMMIGEMKAFTYDRMRKGMAAQPIALAEFIDTGSQFEFDIQIDSRLIQKLTSENSHKEWGGFNVKFERLFGLNESEIASAQPEQIERKVIETILESVKKFGRTIKVKEQQWTDRFDQRDSGELTNFLSGLSENITAGKIGFSSGWFATTVGLAFAEHPRLKQILPDILFVFDLDLIFKIQKLARNPRPFDRDREEQIRLLERRPDAERFPKSRRLTSEGWSADEYIGWFELKNGRMNLAADPVNRTSETEPAKVIDTSEMTFEDQLKALKNRFNS